MILVYKVDRPTRSRADFAKPVELFDEPRVSFVSVTQAFNTTTSVGRLTLNVLLSFAQFEREVSAELQPAEAKRMSAKTTTLPGSSHMSLLSHPAEVASVIEDAAAAAERTAASD